MRDDPLAPTCSLSTELVERCETVIRKSPGRRRCGPTQGMELLGTSVTARSSVSLDAINSLRLRTVVTPHNKSLVWTAHAVEAVRHQRANPDDSLARAKGDSLEG